MQAEAAAGIGGDSEGPEAEAEEIEVLHHRSVIWPCQLQKCNDPPVVQLHSTGSLVLVVRHQYCCQTLCGADYSLMIIELTVMMY